MPGEQKVTVKAEEKGFAEVAEKIDQVTQAEQRLTEQSAQTGRKSEEIAKNVEILVDAEEKLARQHKELGDAAAEASGEMGELEGETHGFFTFLTTTALGTVSAMIGGLEKLTRGLGKVGRGIEAGVRKAREIISLQNAVYIGFVKIAAAARSASRVMRIFPAVHGLVVAGKRIISVLRAEIAERKRLIDVMRLQQIAEETLERGRRATRTVLERIAGQRAMGGFRTPDVARAVWTAAEEAKEKFTQLEPSDILTAYGEFGDIEGLSQRDLVGLATVASFGELDVPKELTAKWRLIFAKDLLERFRKRIDTFAKVETIQGEGLGRPEFKPVGPTERELEIYNQMAVYGKKGAIEQLVEYLREILPADMDPQKAAETLRKYAGKKGMEAHEVGYASARPLTTLLKALQQIPMTEVYEPEEEQKGLIMHHLAKLFGFLWESTDYRTYEWEALKEAAREIQAATVVDEGAKQQAEVAKEASEAMTEPAEADRRAAREEALEKARRRGERAPVPDEGGEGHATVVNNYNYMQHARFVVPDARSRRAVAINGENDWERREIG